MNGNNPLIPCQMLKPRLCFVVCILCDYINLYSPKVSHL